MATTYPADLTPRRVWAIDETGARISIDQMQRSMPYVDVESGTQKRLVTRDPISGLGNLPPERDTLAGSHINHRAQWDAANRDPITGSGHLGEEYNCMYTMKDPRKMKPINETNEDRNPILMEGNLGVELDPMRPHGGRPRNHTQRDANRNPISGTGDFGPKEWDPIYKYRGRMRRSRTAHSEIRRDPICGTGQFAPQEGEALGRPGRRSRSAVNCIGGNPETSPRNPITHVKNPGQPRTPPSEPRIRGDPRDPILGEGFRRKEMMDLWLTPENYCFRSYLLPHGKNKQQEAEPKKETPKRTVRKAPKEPKRTKSTEPKDETAAPKKEPAKKKAPAAKKQPLKKKEKDDTSPEKKTLKGKKPAAKTKKPSLTNGETPNGVDQKENEAPQHEIDRDSIDDHSRKSPDNHDNGDKIMEDSLVVGDKIDKLEFQEGSLDVKADETAVELPRDDKVMEDSLNLGNKTDTFGDQDADYNSYLRDRGADIGETEDKPVEDTYSSVNRGSLDQQDDTYGGVYKAEDNYPDLGGTEDTPATDAYSSMNRGSLDQQDDAYGHTYKAEDNYPEYGDSTAHDSYEDQNKADVLEYPGYSDDRELKQGDDNGDVSDKVMEDSLTTDNKFDHFNDHQQSQDVKEDNNFDSKGGQIEDSAAEPVPADAHENSNSEMNLNRADSLEELGSQQHAEQERDDATGFKTDKSDVQDDSQLQHPEPQDQQTQDAAGGITNDSKDAEEYEEW